MAAADEELDAVEVMVPLRRGARFALLLSSSSK